VAELEIKSDRRRIVIETDVELGDTDELIQQLGRDVDVMNTAVPLDLLTMARVTDAPLEYAYRILAHDGRAWDQTIRFAVDGVTFTFDVVDRWKLEEFSLQRPIRDSFLQLVRNFRLFSFLCEYVHV